MDDCVFCRIVVGEAEASLVHEDEFSVAFMDLLPVVDGQVLVVPRRHAARLGDVEDGTVGHLVVVAARIAAAAARSLPGCAGTTLFLADGEVAGQEVDHVHLHVLPRRTDDGFGLTGEWRQRARSELDDTAAAIRAGLGR